MLIFADPSTAHSKLYMNIGRVRITCIVAILGGSPTTKTNFTVCGMLIFADPSTAHSKLHMNIGRVRITWIVAILGGSPTTKSAGAA